MFSALTQGSLIYLLDKTDGFKYFPGEVVGVSAPRINYSTGNPIVDLKVNIDGTLLEFNQIPGNSTLVTYNNGKLIISETKQGLSQEIETILHNSKLIVDNIDIYKDNIISCEKILKELNPLFAKDKEQEERLSKLEDKFTGVESKLEKLINLMEEKK